MENGYYTYVLQSLKDGKKYTGYTKDLKLRFERHQSGYVDYLSTCPVEYDEGVYSTGIRLFIPIYRERKYFG